MLEIFKGSENLSLKLSNYLSDAATVSFAGGDSIDVGYYKPISDLYIDLKLPTTETENSLSVEAYNGAWQPVSVEDRSNGFNRPGFIRWIKTEDQKKVLLHGKELYWYKLTLENAVSDVEINGLNLIFADDNDLKESYPDIVEYLPEGKESFITYHQEARNYIISNLRNKGKTIRQQSRYKMLDQFDLHNFDEVRQAAKYLALANIFFNESDAVDDKWKQKADGFWNKYSEAINLSFLSIDENDDGVQQANEQSAIQFIKVQRL